MKKAVEKNSNRFKVVYVLVLLAVIIISLLSIHRDITTNDAIVIKEAPTTGSVVTGIYVVNPNEEVKSGENK